MNIKLLLWCIFMSMSINISAGDSENFYAASIAAYNCDVETFKDFFDKLQNKNVEMVDQGMITPLALALVGCQDDRAKRREMVNYALDRGADPNFLLKRKKNGKIDRCSVLFFACILGEEDLVNDLLENGADPDCGDDDFVPVKAAIRNHCLGCLKHLIVRGATIDQSMKIMAEKERDQWQEAAARISSKGLIAVVEQDKNGTFSVSKLVEKSEAAEKVAVTCAMYELINSELKKRLQ